MAEAIVVAGYDRFGKDKKPNPSSEVILPALNERYPGLVATVKLETAYGYAADTLRGVIREVRPEAVVIFGLKGKPDPLFHLELRARNWRESKIADNKGQVGLSVPIIRGAPDNLDSTLPLTDIAAAFDERNVPYTMSDKIGPFVCNDTFYQAVHYTNRMNRVQHYQMRAGLIHFGRELVRRTVIEGASAVVDTLAGPATAG